LAAAQRHLGRAGDNNRRFNFVSEARLGGRVARCQGAAEQNRDADKHGALLPDHFDTSHLTRYGNWAKNENAAVALGGRRRDLLGEKARYFFAAFLSSLSFFGLRFSLFDFI
jgi:hypothetical protein